MNKILIDSYTTDPYYRNQHGALPEQMNLGESAEFAALREMTAGFRVKANPNIRAILTLVEVKEVVEHRIIRSPRPPTTDAEFRAAINAARFDGGLKRAAGHGPSTYTSVNGGIRVVINLSKVHDHGVYWFGLYDKAATFIGSAPVSYVILCCKDTGIFFVIPYRFIETYLTEQGRTNGSATPHWNLILRNENDSWSLTCGNGEYIDLSPYQFD